MTAKGDALGYRHGDAVEVLGQYGDGGPGGGVPGDPVAGGMSRGALWPHGQLRFIPASPPHAGNLLVPCDLWFRAEAGSTFSPTLQTC